MSIRIRGLLQLLSSGIIFALGVSWAVAQREAGTQLNIPTIAYWALAVPGAFALAGLIQTISGVPFSQLSEKWNGLKGWQRGVYGVGILALFGVVFFAAAAAYVYFGA